MSQQARGLRKAIQIVHRHKLLVGVMVALGLLGGGGYAASHPPLVISTALVLLPQTGQSAPIGPNGTSTGTLPSTETQEVIAQSTPVLVAALPHVRPLVSLNELRHAVSIGSETTTVISVTAQEKTAADAAATANAVAESYVSYTRSEASPARVQATFFESATSAGTGRVKQIVNYGVYGLLGALLGALIGVIAAAAVNRSDRRLRKRDEIANSIGVPVLASFPVGHPSSVGKWTTLLEDYKPGALHALQLRNAIKHLETAAAEVRFGSGNGKWSFTVLSMSSDPRALALGPQLGVYAAGQGIPTALVVGPQQDAAVTATLRNACAAPPASSKRPGHLQLIVADENTEVPRDVTLAVVVAVVDGRNPHVPATMRTTSTLLGVSAGSATADQLARVAISAVSDGREISGILVADPDSDDTTTGRLPQLVRRIQRPMPTRVTAIATEIRR
jgi:capsular polysaccharide biosynthesis protein